MRLGLLVLLGVSVAQAEVTTWVEQEGRAGPELRAVLAPAGGLPADWTVSGEGLGAGFVVRVVGPPDEIPSVVDLVALDADGAASDRLVSEPLASEPCPEGTARELVCARTGVFWLALVALDRDHPRVTPRALLGLVGGSVAVTSGSETLLRLPIGGPGLLGGRRHRVTLRPFVLRQQPGGRPVLGDTDAEARRYVAVELTRGAEIFGQCGIELDGARAADVTFLDPPTLALVTVGCEDGARASGGEVELVTSRGAVRVRTRAGASPTSVGLALAAELRKRGSRVRTFENAQVARAGLRTIDLVLDGETLMRARSTDPTLGVCRAAYDPGDGLAHFGDGNSSAGTPEERALLRAVSDDDPSTIEVVVIGQFSGRGRIGESFIHGPGSSLEGAVIVDRAGLYAGVHSFTLAHELGHVLLDFPGHTDDHGVDDPSALMDADASDATAFGPRRLSADECLRAVTQSGPLAPVPLLRAEPLPGQRSAERSAPGEFSEASAKGAR